MSERGQGSSSGGNRRWNKKSKRRSSKTPQGERESSNAESSPSSPPSSYKPPSLEDDDNSNNNNKSGGARRAGTWPDESNNNNNNNNDDYVTQPPKLKNKGLTGKISTLFRSSREQQAQAQRNNNSLSEDDYFSSKSGASSSSTVHSSRSKQRIFYSSNADDDSDDDSYESRYSNQFRSMSSTSAEDYDYRGRPRRGSSSNRGGGGNDDDGSVRSTGSPPKTILRYRGFSTSIKSLFLDEPLVCASTGCFGLILSNRTEYLLQVRNERRGATSPRGHYRPPQSNRHKLPSRIIAYALVITILLMFSTFLIFGFGTGNGLATSGGGNSNSGGSYNNGDGGGSYNDDNDDAYNGDDMYSAWDDYLNNDYYQGGYNNDDGGGNNYNNDDDDAVNNNDDDGGNNNDDDDAGGNNNDDDDDDDAGNNDDDAGGGNNRRDRSLFTGDSDSTEVVVVVVHHVHGVFKLRDYQESLWNPIWESVQEEWNSLPRDITGERLDDATPTSTSSSTASSSSSSSQFHRRNQDSYYDEAAWETALTRQQRDIGSSIRIALLIAFLLFLGVLGRRRRMRTRFYLVRARAQEDHLFYASSEVGSSKRVAFRDTREDQYEGACSHTLCGCYPVDGVAPEEEDQAEEVEVTDTGVFRRKKKPHHEDIVARGFNCCMACCCGFICKCWFQCLSICALAQEAREIRLLLPPRYQRVDFITHQPFHEYEKNINDLRRGWMGVSGRVHGIVPHYNALSRLSRYIIILGTLSVIAIVATLIFNPRAAFSWQDAVVLAATFLQSFLVLFIVHGIFHKSDLSLDAVIKLFAAGFLIAVPSAFFFEGLLVNVILFVAWGLFELSAVIFGEGFATWIFNHWRLVWMLGELFNAFVVAAITEELCKYYTFRSVEHPDLVFLTGLQRDEQGENAVDGGLVKYPFGAHQVQQMNKERSDDASTRSHRSNRSKRSRRSSRSARLMDEFDPEEEEPDVRTCRQRAMAITTGMISVAVGLACAENFLYVFVLGGALGNDEEEHKHDVIEAWIVLFFRSIFPVHALAAAMQSINMIRKFVETSDDAGGHRIGVGRIILPAVILHGSFDAVLMAINVYVETAWDKYLEENDGNIGEKPPYNSVILNLVAWISITAIMIAGIAWYYRENRRQRLRLKVLEEKEAAEQGRGKAQEVELV